MSWSKGSDKLTQPNEELSKNAGAVRNLAFRLFAGMTNADSRQNPSLRRTSGGVIPLDQRKVSLQAFRDAVYENYRRVQIR